MSTVFTSTIAHGLKATLNTVITDDTDGYDKGALVHQWMDEKNQSDYWEDDLEVGGPGLASEKDEGAEIATGTIREGYRTRYIPRTFALKLIVTEEAMEDNKYGKIIDSAKRLKRALWKTVDMDSTNVLVRATDTNYVGGDGLSLANSAHTLPGGGTFSNTMATAMSPSRAAVIVATTAIRKLPGHDGLTEGYMPKKVLCPVDQWAVWDALIKSTHAPEAGQFNAINVVNQSLSLSVVANKYWSNTTTNWALTTDCDNGLNFRWRRKPKSNTWVDNGQMLMNYAISSRWARGWSDPRSFYFVAA